MNDFWLSFVKNYERQKSGLKGPGPKGPGPTGPEPTGPGPKGPWAQGPMGPRAHGPWAHGPWAHAKCQQLWKLSDPTSQAAKGKDKWVLHPVGSRSRLMKLTLDSGQ